MKNVFFIPAILLLFISAFWPAPGQANGLDEKLKGRILLQVEANGEAWYVNPVNQNRYFLGRPADAFAIMRALGLGVNNFDFDSFKGKGPMRLAGRILIKVEDSGRAYYINPVDLKMHYLGRPADAFALMRALGLGITTLNLNKIKVASDSKPSTGDSAYTIGLRLVAQNLVSPIALVSARDNSGRLFVADQAGLIRIIDKDGNLLATPFLDLKSKMVSLNSNYDERGLLGLAFHPNFTSNGKFYVYYSVPRQLFTPAGWDHTSRISEFRVTGTNANQADLASEKIILEIDQPQSNHNGGQIAFGPDSYLYIPLGDGGNANDIGTGHVAGGNAQDMNQLLGKILRLDINSSSAYDIPSDNPFVNANGRDEIYASGFRNPFHISFDAAGSRSLIAADAGQNRWEEVDVVVKGGNYGWNIKEGKHCFDPNNPNSSPAGCSSQGKVLIDPVVEYANQAQGAVGKGSAVMGGFVYRGSALSALYGKYIFGDWSRSFSQGDGSLFAADMTASSWPYSELRVSNNANGRLGHFLMGFGQDENNELYILTKNSVGPTGSTGRVYKIISASSAAQSSGRDDNSVDEFEIKLKNFSFMPQTITVKAGSRIKWVNEDNVTHTVEADNGLFKSGDLAKDGRYELTLTAKGTYHYHCGPHPSMTGTIIVE